jgi:hypothetical protein
MPRARLLARASPLLLVVALAACQSPAATPATCTDDPAAT